MNQTINQKDIYGFSQRDGQFIVIMKLSGTEARIAGRQIVVSREEWHALRTERIEMANKS